MTWSCTWSARTTKSSSRHVGRTATGEPTLVEASHLSKTVRAAAEAAEADQDAEVAAEAG